jgi:hypothetical protein
MGVCQTVTHSVYGWIWHEFSVGVGGLGRGWRHSVNRHILHPCHMLHEFAKPSEAPASTIYRLNKVVQHTSRLSPQ